MNTNPNRTVTTVSTVVRHSPVFLGFHQYFNGQFRPVYSDMQTPTQTTQYRDGPSQHNRMSSRVSKKERLTAKQRRALAKEKELRKNQEAIKAIATEKRLLKNQRAREARAVKKAALALRNQRAREARAAKKAAGATLLD